MIGAPTAETERIAPIAPRNSSARIVKDAPDAPILNSAPIADFARNAASTTPRAKAAPAANTAYTLPIGRSISAPIAAPATTRLICVSSAVSVLIAVRAIPNARRDSAWRIPITTATSARSAAPASTTARLARIASMRAIFSVSNAARYAARITAATTAFV